MFGSHSVRSAEPAFFAGDAFFVAAATVRCARFGAADAADAERICIWVKAAISLELRVGWRGERRARMTGGAGGGSASLSADPPRAELSDDAGLSDESARSAVAASPAASGANHSPRARADGQRQGGRHPRQGARAGLPHRPRPAPAHTRVGRQAPRTRRAQLLSTAGTGFFYVTKKNPRKLPGKLEFMKYDPRVRRHVLFSETKLK